MKRNALCRIGLVVALLIIAGCIYPQMKTSTLPMTPSTQLIHDTAGKIDWLTLIGAVAIAFGVAAYLNGNTKAVSVVAAGITLVACGLIITTTLAAIQEYKMFFLIALAAIAIIAFFVFARTALDMDKDGKVTWADIVAMITKYKKKPPTA